MFGVDISSRMVDVARSKLGKDRVWVASAQSLPFKSASFDFLVACRVFSHVRRLAKALNELRRVAREGAILVVTDVHPSHRYKHTRVSGEWGEVTIHTIKHAPDKVTAIAASLGWTLVAEDVLTATSASWLPMEDERFQSIDRTGIRPVCYILVLRATGGSRASQVRGRSPP
jgi:SAM-dependent methyltransferase